MLLCASAPLEEVLPWCATLTPVTNGSRLSLLLPISWYHIHQFSTCFHCKSWAWLIMQHKWWLAKGAVSLCLSYFLVPFVSWFPCYEQRGVFEISAFSCKMFQALTHTNHEALFFGRELIRIDPNRLGLSHFNLNPAWKPSCITLEIVHLSWIFSNMYTKHHRKHCHEVFPGTPMCFP